MSDPQQAAAKKKPEFLEILESRRSEIESVCVKALKPERLIKLAQQAFSRVPKLAQCDPASIYLAVLHCAETGLEPGPMQHAAIVPFMNTKANPPRMEAQFMAMYKGLLVLARRSQEVKSIHCDVVHFKDEFTYWTDENGRHMKHVPSLDPDPGRVTHAYMVAELDGTKPQIEVMTFAQLETIRKKAKSSSGPWVTDTDEMYRKTVFKRGSKWLPLSTEAAIAIALDNENERDANAIETQGWTAPQATARMAATGLIPLALPEPRETDTIEAVADDRELEEAQAKLEARRKEEEAPEPGSVDPDEDKRIDAEQAFASVYADQDDATKVALWQKEYEGVHDLKGFQQVTLRLDRVEKPGSPVRKQVVAFYETAKDRATGRKKR